MVEEMPLKRRVRQLFREALSERYATANLQKYPELAALSPEMIEAFRNFLLNRVYPDAAAREEIDGAFQRLKGILQSPARLKNLMAPVLTLLWRLGRYMPAMITAGKGVIEAFERLEALEDAVMAVLEETGETEKLSKTRFTKTLGRTPRSYYDHMVESLGNLLRITAHPQTISASLELLGKIAASMEAAPTLWDEEERRGMRLALETLSEGERLFTLLDKKEIPGLIAAVRRVEEDWVNRVLSGEG